MTAIVPVILSGGSGTRLWPLSTPARPKQLLALTADETMLQLTARRASGARFAGPIVVANAAHAEEIGAQLHAIAAPVAKLILEPAGRNTAPAIALAAMAVEDPSAPLLVMPSDQVVTDTAAFHAAIDAALPLVEQGWLTTFGIAPDAPETGYGWIAIGEDLAPGVHRVRRFVEKPPRAEAEAMLAAGGFAWNGGIFLFRADAYLAALEIHAPEIVRDCRIAMEQARRVPRDDGDEWIYPDAAAFAACPSDSIDYAVMEKADRVAVAPVAMGWSDLGSWDALHALGADADGNALHGDVVALETTGTLVRSEGKRVALVGVSDLIVVAAGDDILILPRGRSQEVKAVLAAMQRR